MKQLMWIENKTDGLVGPARIGWVDVLARGKRLEYRGRVFRSLRGRGSKANFVDVESGDEYWISGCRKDGRDALYGTDVEIDADALEEYWLNVRRLPEKRRTRRFHAAGKY